MAYASNPALQAERAKLRSIDEGVAIAKSDWRPSLTAQADAGFSHQEFDNTSGDLKPIDTNLTLSQPVFNGGSTIAATRQAEQNVAQERAQLTVTEQTVLVSAATAYLDVLQDEAVLSLYAANEISLKDWLEQAEQRFKLGEKTRTDVSQSESRLARAHADRNNAEQNLSIARASYLRFIGQAPGTLTKPVLNPVLPKSREEAANWASDSAPAVIAASHAEKAAKANIGVVRGSLLPVVSLNGSLNDTRNENVPQVGIANNRTQNNEVLLQVKVPLYTGGGDYARLRAAYQERSEKREEVSEAQRVAEDTAFQAWDQMEAAANNIGWRQEEVASASAALDGMKQEERVGDRTSTDTLNAEQELLDSKVSALQAEHDRTVAMIQLMAAVGQFTAKNLKLNVDLYDPQRHYASVQNKWIGTGSEEH